MNTVEIFAEMPESLHQQLQGFLNAHPDWDYGRAIAAALALFLIQCGDEQKKAARIYLDSMLGGQAS